MKKIVYFGLVIAATTLGGSAAMAQGKYFSKNATISFDAEGKLDDVEEIKAKTNSATCVYDAATGAFEWAVPIKTFVFANSLMQEHFNENYMETSKFPKAIFKGKVQNYPSIDLSKDGTYPTQVVGKMLMHGVSKDVTINGSFTVAKGQITGTSAFEVALKDYNIQIPSVVFMKVAEVVKISVNTPLQPLK